jgi:hypothetical protein
MYAHAFADFADLNARPSQENISALPEDDLAVVVDDEGAGESVDPDPVVPTVGAN